MKRIFSFVAGAMLALGSFGLVSAASAADLYVPKKKAPDPVYMAPTPVYDPSGFFIVGYADYAMKTIKVGGESFSLDGAWLGGGLGYTFQNNWQLELGGGMLVSPSGGGLDIVNKGEVVSCGGCPGGSIPIGTFTNYRDVGFGDSWSIGAKVWSSSFFGVSSWPGSGLRLGVGVGYESTSVNATDWTYFALSPLHGGGTFSTPKVKSKVTADGAYVEALARYDLNKYAAITAAYQYSFAEGASQAFSAGKVEGDQTFLVGLRFALPVTGQDGFYRR